MQETHRWAPPRDQVVQVGCPRNKQKKIRFEPKQTETKSVPVFVSVCFVKPKTKNVGLFWGFEPISKQSKQSELLRNKPKQTETTLNFHKIPKYALYHTVSVGILFVLVKSKHRNSLFRYRSEATKTNYFKTNQNKPQYHKNPKFPEIPKYTPYQTVSVGLLFVSVQSKHRKISVSV